MKNLFFLLAVMVLVSCNKSNISGNVPGCIKRKITDFDKNNSCASAHVDEYHFQDRTVYAFDPGNCGADMTCEIIDENCNSMGSTGGIAGNTYINGEDFSSATFKKTVWEK